MLGYPKPLRGTHVLEREAQRAKTRTAEDKAKAKAKKRDYWGCRWPVRSGCRGWIEGAHIFHDKGMGGDHGTVSDTWNLMALCEWHHRHGPASIHGKQLKVEPMTELGADAVCSFWRRDEHGIWVCVGRELRIGVLEHD